MAPSEVAESIDTTFPDELSHESCAEVADADQRLTRGISTVAAHKPMRIVFPIECPQLALSGHSQGQLLAQSVMHYRAGKRLLRLIPSWPKLVNGPPW
jgi:hypothetical protein